MIRIHDLVIVENEHLYGPGKRLLLFLKGCSIHCKGCVNEHLWPFEGGTMIEAQTIVELCCQENLDGVTIHGGEPLDQADELIELVKKIKNQNLTVILFTGYIKKQLNNVQKSIWNMSDIVVAGRFDERKLNYNLQFRGSTNQRVYAHNGKYKNYKVEDGFTTAIFTIDQKGNIDITGFLTDDIKRLIEENTKNK